MRGAYITKPEFGKMKFLSRTQITKASSINDRRKFNGFNASEALSSYSMFKSKA